MTDGTPTRDGLANPPSEALAEGLVIQGLEPPTEAPAGEGIAEAGPRVTLVPFGSTRWCPKCGNGAISRIYHKNGHCMECPGRSAYHNCCVPESEHHLRICLGCGYRFAEMVRPV